MTAPVITEDFSWYTDKRRVKDLKRSSDSLKWKTHVESVKETVTEINKTLSTKASDKAFRQPLEKAIVAAGVLFEDFCRLESKLKTFQKAENEMLKPKVTNDHLTWHTNCQ